MSAVKKLIEESEVRCAWIFGGGPSLPVQFGVPQSLVESVHFCEAPLSSYTPYFASVFDSLYGAMKDKFDVDSPPHKRKWIVLGVNNAYLLGLEDLGRPFVHGMFFGDRSWYKCHSNFLSSVPPNFLLMSCAKMFDSRIVKEEDRRIYYFPRSDKICGISDCIGEVCWNYNSGGAAIDVAYQLGAKVICLFGFDMRDCVDGLRVSHWHPAHTNWSVERKRPYSNYINALSLIAKDAVKKKVKIYVVDRFGHSKLLDFFDRISIGNACDIALDSVMLEKN